MSKKDRFMTLTDRLVEALLPYCTEAPVGPHDATDHLCIRLQLSAFTTVPKNEVERTSTNMTGTRVHLHITCNQDGLDYLYLHDLKPFIYQLIQPALLCYELEGGAEK